MVTVDDLFKWLNPEDNYMEILSSVVRKMSKSALTRFKFLKVFSSPLIKIVGSALALLFLGFINLNGLKFDFPEMPNLGGREKYS